MSPDGAWVGFATQSNRRLYKVSVLGGSPVPVTDALAVEGGASWGVDDQIIFGSPQSGLFRVPADGGAPEALTTLNPEAGELGHRNPFIVPGRDVVLFEILTGPDGPVPATVTRESGGGEDPQLAALDLTTGLVTPLGLTGRSPHYAPSGHVVYAVADGSIRAVPFAVDSLTVSGGAVPVVEGVHVKPGGANFSLSSDGRLVYVAGGGASFDLRTFVWVDRNGQEEPVAADAAAYVRFDLSPDGTRVAVELNNGVWIYDLTRDTSTRLTFDADGVASGPKWTPDGARVAFGAPLSWKRADGVGAVERLVAEGNRSPMAFSPDGTSLVFVENRSGNPANRGGNLGLGVLSLEGDRTATVLIDDPQFTEVEAALSPDGRWLAYRSNESGRGEIYVRPFPDVDSGRWQISNDGGAAPVWNPAGNELFYRGPTGVMILPFDTQPTFTPGAVTRLFEWTFANIGVIDRQMAVSPDGQRFLMLKDETGNAGGEAARPQINVVLNWFTELERLVPTH